MVRDYEAGASPETRCSAERRWSIHRSTASLVGMRRRFLRLNPRSLIPIAFAKRNRPTRLSSTDAVLVGGLIAGFKVQVELSLRLQLQVAGLQIAEMQVDGLRMTVSTAHLAAKSAFSRSTIPRKEPL